MAADRRFPAMGTDAHLVVVGANADRVANAASARIEDLEAKWSRFRPASEVSAINEGAGALVPVSADTRLLVERAIEAWRLTGGFVDCTLLEHVVAAGYDRSFTALPEDRDADDVPSRPGMTLLGPLDIAVEAGGVRLPAGLGFDPGGIGKGLAADLVSAEAMAAGAEGVCINLGGDLRVRGNGPDGGPWTISLDHPAQPTPIALVGLHEGAVATSTTLRRRWLVAGQERHHLIDPRTGEPSTSDITYVSVVAAEAWRAEVLAKGVLLRGGPHPFDLIGGTGAEALVVDRTGIVSASEGLGAYLGTQVLPTHLSVDALEGAS